MGYCGTQPCGQTKGPRFFYNEERTPTDILMAGDVSPLYLIGTVAKTFFCICAMFCILWVNSRLIENYSWLFISSDHYLQYHPVPVMYGAAKDEGSFIYGTLYTEWMVKNNHSMVK